MNVLVIGGTRFFGKRLVNMLLDRGDSVTIITRGSNPFGDKVRHLRVDRKDRSALLEAVKGQHFDAVVDQVCFTPQEAQDAAEVFRGKTSHYIMTSTLSVYHAGAGLKEEDFDPIAYPARVPAGPGEEYAEGKRRAERVFVEKAPFKTAFARFPVVLGEDDYTKRLYNQVKKVQNGDPIFYPNLDARFSFIHAEDAARALLWLLDSRHEGPFNFSAPDAVQIKDLIRMMERAAGKKANLLQEFSEEALSPLGPDTDMFMNPGKARSMGFESWKLEDWLGKLIQKFAEK